MSKVKIGEKPSMELEMLKLGLVIKFQKLKNEKELIPMLLEGKALADYLEVNNEEKDVEKNIGSTEGDIWTKPI